MKKPKKETRHSFILRILQKGETANTYILADLFQCSQATIKKDMKELQEQHPEIKKEDANRYYWEVNKPKRKSKPIMGPTSYMVSRVMFRAKRHILGIKEGHEICISQGEQRRGEIHEYWHAPEKDYAIIHDTDGWDIKLPKSHMDRFFEVVADGWDDWAIPVKEGKKHES